MESLESARKTTISMKGMQKEILNRAKVQQGV